MIRSLLAILLTASITSHAQEPVDPDKELVCGKHALNVNSMQVEITSIQIELSILLKNAELLQLKGNKLNYVGKIAQLTDNNDVIRVIIGELEKNTALFKKNAENYEKLIEVEAEMNAGLKDIANEMVATECPSIELSAENIEKICKKFDKELSKNLNCIAYKAIKSKKDELKKGESKKIHPNFQET